MSEIELRQSLLDAIEGLKSNQKIKLLDFIKSMAGSQDNEQKNSLLKFAGTLSDDEANAFSLSVDDCKKIPNLNLVNW